MKTDDIATEFGKLTTKKNVLYGAMLSTAMATTFTIGHVYGFNAATDKFPKEESQFEETAGTDQNSSINLDR